jgi:hypothetical protein
MGSMKDGIQSQIDFSTAATIGGKIDLLLAAIPDPDSTSTSGAIQGIAGFLDEMSPITAAELRVEIAALRTSANGGNTEIANGVYTVTAADATANHADIVTGLADLTLTKSTVKVTRAGADVTVDAVVTEPVAGTLRVADGGTTYNMTAGDLIYWTART